VCQAQIDTSINEYQGQRKIQHQVEHMLVISLYVNFSKEIVSGTHSLTKISAGGGYVSFRNCTKYASLFEER
jgi:hypothetical protein